MSADGARPGGVRKDRLTAKDRKALGVAVIGWSVDMYDLLVILHVASYVSAAFFPSENPVLGLTATFAAFAVSLVVRPIGALVFGSIADRTGRRRAMRVSVLGAGVLTAAMGFLPGIATIGVAAPVLLLLLRVAQGLFVGGITASTHTIATESLPERWRGMAAGLVKGGGASLAVVVINLLVIILSAVTGQAAFADWGWRGLFVFALAGSLLNFALLRGTEESPAWVAKHSQADSVREQPAKSPVRVLFSQQWRALVFLTAAIVFTASAPYYLTTGILPTVYKQVLGLSQDAASTFLIINVTLSAAVAAYCGHLSQRVGRRRVFLMSGIACLVLLPALYVVMMDRPAEWLLLVCGALMVMASGAISAPLIIFINELFPTDIRSTATAFAWSVGYGLSGLLPTLVTALSGDLDRIIPVLAVSAAITSAGFLLLISRTEETRGALSEARPTTASVDGPLAG
ncbi:MULTISPECIES: MFS transporter [Streptomyces]|uniref:MFS transporter n=1 Tax=Streptomyces doudnae TaxID=3075536 RepID=A0ABD5EZR6_9ACTN|nr:MULTISPECIES: MFS transporter [unclassified Streptomyces]MDT0440276.1 MFS transporter [Streptomyces sp. DSM 41981]MYQ62051.1 MFS transporter [Streptomyces sp. SID4950]SCD29450.1 Sugar phosphate permease [Streptomyces sp. SolWspMP-5a-2]